jgi:hypothetical protein
MIKTRSTGTALSPETQKTSNRALINNSIYVTKHEQVPGKSGSTGSNTSSNNHPPSLHQEYLQSHKVRVDMARKYMKQHGGTRFPRSKSPDVDPLTHERQQQQQQALNDNAHITIQQVVLQRFVFTFV